MSLAWSERWDSMFVTNACNWMLRVTCWMFFCVIDDASTLRLHRTLHMSTWSQDRFRRIWWLMMFPIWLYPWTWAYDSIIIKTRHVSYGSNVVNSGVCVCEIQNWIVVAKKLLKGWMAMPLHRPHWFWCLRIWITFEPKKTNDKHPNLKR